MVVPGLEESVKILAGQFRIVTEPELRVPPSLVLVYYFCPCGRHRSHFTIHRSILLSYIASNRSIMPYLQEQVRIHRLISEEARAQRQLEVQKEEAEAVVINVNVDVDEEEDLNR